jgi:hypothetical protein
MLESLPLKTPLTQEAAVRVMETCWAKLDTQPQIKYGGIVLVNNGKNC